ncbi:MAG TPA: hypothetical protein VFG05_02805 [Methylocella sp.]|nr:hypothetical protein [Methylocella sp.]
MRFRLSPPGLPILLLSLALAGVAVATFYMRVPAIGHYVSAHRFWIMAAAYVTLLAGVIFRGL